MKGLMIMEDIKFAQLDPQQLAKINELEKKIGVTLIAYDSSSGSSHSSDAYETNNSTTANHPS
ncbi:hypothetical protein AK833_05130 [Lysinibacillus sp. F5]|uniref:Uncharacterized protein n=2 Tax=Bacillaceae TaxID=186817 RepID=A0A2I0UV07_9BACI|nr:hypothetical protein AK833_05130 [Lysinibacillus sp. F5]PKU49871.1 hypothetical protein CRI88_21040 [Lysinibacillus fusiformis]